jgi:hypothetical protein
VSVHVHEASHVAAAVMLGRPVDHVWIETGHTLPGDTIGSARIPVGERVESSQVPICLVGYMSEDEPDWPPRFEDAHDEKLEALGIVIGFLGLSEELYDELVGIARDMLADPDFVRLRNSIARALAAVPRLEREDVEALCRATGTPVPDREEQLCNA